jgi:hypothetical protein
MIKRSRRRVWATRKKFNKTLIILAIFAVAMAYLEASVVIYLRKLFGLANQASFPSLFSKQDIALSLGFISFLKAESALKMFGTYKLLFIEQLREASTIIILACIAWLTKREWLARISAFLFAFGVWDIFYYLFLYIWLRWPSSVTTPDILFLIPSPWLAPVFVPLIASTFFIIIGATLFQKTTQS